MLTVKVRVLYIPILNAIAATVVAILLSFAVMVAAVPRVITAVEVRASQTLTREFVVPAYSARLVKSVQAVIAAPQARFGTTMRAAPPIVLGIAAQMGVGGAVAHVQVASIAPVVIAALQARHGTVLIAFILLAQMSVAISLVPIIVMGIQSGCVVTRMRMAASRQIGSPIACAVLEISAWNAALMQIVLRVVIQLGLPA
ncbi:MAG: hypothetical protein ABIG95_06750 [Candidatus Woesearchaeota archaeon]